MKLFISPNSPYGRIARIAAIEIGLADRIEHIYVENRTHDNPLLQYSPVARVPTLVFGDLVISESRHICAYFDEFMGVRRFFPARHVDKWQEVGLEGVVVGFLDGLAVLAREFRRDETLRAGDIVEWETTRAERCLDWIEKKTENAVFHSRRWDFPAIALACALGLADHSLSRLDWRDGRPHLDKWYTDRLQLSAMIKTMPVGD